MRKQSNTQMELKGNLTILKKDQLQKLKGGENRTAPPVEHRRPRIIIVDDSGI